MKRGKRTSNSSGSDPEYALVYSTDPIKIPKKKVETGYSGPLKPAVHKERKGRNGKTVTILTKLPAHNTLLKDLCAYLKKALGSGGTFAIEDGMGVIEVQGDHGEQITDLLARYQNKS